LYPTARMTSGRFPVRRGADAGRIVAISDENESVGISFWKPTRPSIPLGFELSRPPSSFTSRGRIRRSRCPIWWAPATTPSSESRGTDHENEAAHESPGHLSLHPHCRVTPTTWRAQRALGNASGNRRRYLQEGTRQTDR